VLVTLLTNVVFIVVHVCLFKSFWVVNGELCCFVLLFLLFFDSFKRYVVFLMSMNSCDEQFVKEKEGGGVFKRN